MPKIKSVYVVPPEYGVDTLFSSFGYKTVSSPYDADAIVFTGGADIDPGLYGQERLPDTFTNPVRDQIETRLFQTMQKDRPDIPMIGICRGGQLLNVLAGGSLFQDVDNHGTDHAYTLLDTSGNIVREAKTTSCHHQMMQPTQEGMVLGFCSVASFKKTDKKVLSTKEELEVDPEIIWYPKKGIYCFQGHPEWDMAGDTAKVFFDHIEELYA